MQVVELAGADTGAGEPRDPHRHDYHELFWLRRGSAEHQVDGCRTPAGAGTLTLVGRGQVHQLRRGRGMHGAVLRFGDEVLHGAAQRVATGWLLSRRGALTIVVPADQRDDVDGLVALLASEAARGTDAFTADLDRALVSALLLWIERWHAADRGECRDVGDADVRLHRRFTEVLEHDYATHHDAAHYADALGVPQAALSRMLTRLTGRATKQLVLDRVMLEAARLLQFTDLAVGEVAFRVGYEDQLYFSRAFRRRFGRSPVAYRDAARGRA